MAIEIKMPQLSDTMHSGKILGWKKKEGDKVSRGDILAEVETEKANLEIESFHQGTLLKVLVPAQTMAGVGDVIAIIGEPGEAVGAGGSNSASNNNGSSAPKAAATSSSSAPSPASTNAVQHQTPPPAAHVAQSQSVHSSGQQGRIKASPLAKKIAAEQQIDLTQIQGSGPDGRIIRSDVTRAASSSTGTSNAASAGNNIQASQSSHNWSAPTTTSAPSTGSSPTVAVSGAAVLSGGAISGGSTREMSKMRSLIASRMQESVREAPHFYVTTKINMGEAKRLQSALKARPEYSHLSINHLVIKAAAYALAREPRVNNAVKNGQIYSPGSINIGIITAVEDGLLIPVIREADKLSLKDLAFEAKAAIERAKAGRPTSADLSGGTFSISNMGMFDVENFTAIINPGQGAVLAVSSTITEPIVQKGAIIVGETMKATLSVDHRIIDGVMGATFLKFFKEALELPALLMN